MIIISHRGNIDGPDLNQENSPKYLEKAIELGFEIEIDLWVQDNLKFYLGHDRPEYLIELKWIENHREKLWIHCKNFLALKILKDLSLNLNFFWHETDKFTITSKGFIWTFPGNPVNKNSIMVYPEHPLNAKFRTEIKSDQVFGICTDFAEDYAE